MRIVKDLNLLKTIFERYKYSNYFFPLIGAVLENKQLGVVFVDNIENPQTTFVVHKFGFAQIIFKSTKQDSWEWIDKLIDKGIVIEGKTLEKIRFYTTELSLFNFVKNSSKYTLQFGERVRFIYDGNHKFLKKNKQQFLYEDINLVNSQFDLDIGKRFWNNKNDFYHNSHIYCVKDKGILKSVCYAVSVSNNKAEIDINTKEAYRKKGLAKEAIKGFINNCLESRVIPLWDCYENNAASMNTAKSIGFSELFRYQFIILTVKPPPPKYVFVGNRKFVLKEMIKNNLDIERVFVIKNTHLEKDILSLGVKFDIINSKKRFLELLETTNFDILISNGCPFILPIQKLKKAKYINIHPSFLPDLRGVDPVVGSILYNKDSGATCHFMDEGIDTGDIIEQVKIPYTEDLDVSLLYQLSFIAEKEVFNLSLKSNFVKQKSQAHTNTDIYYKRSIEDITITFCESNQEIHNKIKAFNNRSQGARFKHLGKEFKVYAMVVIKNNYVVNLSKKCKNLQIIMVYEDNILFKKDKEVIKFSNITGELKMIKKGDTLRCNKLVSS